MLDPAYVRDHADDVKRRLSTRTGDFSADLTALHALDTERLAAIQTIENLKREQNSAGEEVARAKKDGRDATEILAKNKARAGEIKALEPTLTDIDARRDALMLAFPNLPHASVPVGKSSAENVEVRAWGSPEKKPFTPKPHWELGEALGILNFERATRMSGARFSVLTGAGARLERALINFMLDVHTREHGYTEVVPPYLVNRNALTGTGNLPKFEQDLFKVAGEWDLFLIPTAEVPLTNLHREEVLDSSEHRLPLKYTAYTPCFRSEAGSYGSDVRGLIRQHQFDKVELVKFTTPEQSYDELESLTRNAESILERLNLPYRRVLLCTGDMGFASAKTYDIEVWLPSQQKYREISSCSNCEEFQARRAGIRYRIPGVPHPIREKARAGKTTFVHTLNGSGLAIGRTLIAILENFQEADGSVTLPEVLWPYMGGLKRIPRR